MAVSTSTIIEASSTQASSLTSAEDPVAVINRLRKQSSPITTSSTSAEETLATSPTEDLQQGSAAASTFYKASSTQAIKETLGNVSNRVVEPVELALLHD